MPEYKKVKELIPHVAAYIAGLIDGEGTVTLSRRHAKENRQVVVSIANTERALLAFVLLETGVGKITRKSIAHAHHTPSYTYCVSNRQALDLLQQTVPYMRSYKKARAILALTNYIALTPRNGKYTLAMRERRKAFEISFLQTLPEGTRRSINE